MVVTILHFEKKVEETSNFCHQEKGKKAQKKPGATIKKWFRADVSLSFFPGRARATAVQK